VHWFSWGNCEARCRVQESIIELKITDSKLQMGVGEVEKKRGFYAVRYY
jgi:hypothetical protein